MTRVGLSQSAVAFLPQGAIIQEFSVAGHNLVLSFPSAEPYLQAPYFGETIGRVANRIRGGLIQNLNGRSYQLTVNLDGQNHLHGGTIGWGHRKFSGPLHLSRNGKDTVQFTYLSPDGEQGYPGTVELRVWYTAYEQDDATVLEIEYEAELVGSECEETIINVTNHSYFNLSGDSTIEGTQVSLETNDFLVTDENGVPTEEITSYPGIQAGQSFVLGASEPAIDHCFVMDKNANHIPVDTRPRELRRLVIASHQSTGIHLEVSSTEPSFQFYTGDYVDVAATDHTAARAARAGFCVEPGRFINAINVPEWSNQVILSQGRVWGSRIVYKAWKA